MAATNEELEIAQKAIEKSLSEKVPFVKGSGAPVSTPYFAGQMYYDTTATTGESKWYFSHDDGGLVWLDLGDGSGSAAITTWYSLTGYISDANAAAPAFIDGDIFLLNSNTASPSGTWGTLPAGIGDGDIITRDTGAWVLTVDISTKAPHSVIAEFDTLWAVILGAGTWLNIPEYNPGLDDSITTQFALGGYPAGTQVGDLRYQTWGTIIDTLIFPITLPTYTIPTLISSDDVFKERGKDLTGILSFTFTKNDAADATSTVADFLDNVGTPIWSNPIAAQAGNFVTNIDLDDPTYDVVTTPTAGEHVTVKYSVVYAQGATKNDSHGNADTRPPSSGGDGPVEASTVIQTVEYGSLYPYWVIASSDAALDPGDPGNAAAAPVLTEIWIRANMTQALFNEDGLNKEVPVIPVATGSEYLIAVCPPGFNVTAAVDADYGFAYDAMVTQTFTMSIDDAGGGTNLATYNVHFFRNVSVGGWAENQNVTVTIE